MGKIFIVVIREEIYACEKNTDIQLFIGNSLLTLALRDSLSDSCSSVGQTLNNNYKLLDGGSLQPMVFERPDQVELWLLGGQGHPHFLLLPTSYTWIVDPILIYLLLSVSSILIKKNLKILYLELAWDHLTCFCFIYWVLHHLIYIFSVLW